MAGSRSFRRGETIVFDTSWNAAPSAALSLAVVVKPTTVSGDQVFVESRYTARDDFIFGLDGAAPFVFALSVNRVILAGDPVVAATAGDWQLFGISKPRGTSQVRFHRVRLSNGAATYSDAVARSPGLADVQTGRWALADYQSGSSQDFGGLIAALGVWNIDLSTADFARMTSWRGMMSTAPRALWRLDGSTFDDQTGRDNDESGTTTTVHDNDEPSGFWPVHTTGRSYGGYGSGNWPPSTWRPYKATSIWNTPVDPRIDVVHRDSAAIVAKVLSLSGIGNPPVGHLVSGRADSEGDYSHPLYFAREDDPWFTLDFRYHGDPDYGSHALQGTRVQIPDDARPAGGTDHHLVVVQPPARDLSGNYLRDAGGNYIHWEYDLWEVVAKPSGGGTLRCGWGGRHEIDGDGHGPGANATAARFGLIAGTIRANELTAGQIDHALFCVVAHGAKPGDLDFGYGTRPGDVANGSWVHPATHGDAYDTGGGATDDAPPMGARFWLDMTPLQIEALNLDPWKETILKALARYGAYFGDTGGAGFGFQFDGGQAYTSFGVADPLVAYGAAARLVDVDVDEFTSAYADPPVYGDYVFDLSSGVDWASYLRVLVPPLGPYPLAVFGDDPVACWRLGEASGSDAADQQGDANPGGYVGGVTLGAASLLPTAANDTAVTLDGSSGFVGIYDDNALDLTSAFSLEAWIKPADLPSSGNYRSIVAKEEAYALQFRGDQLEFTVIHGGTRERVLASSGAIVAGNAYHVVGTFDGTTQRLYIDGVEVRNRAYSGSADSVSNALLIGSWDGNGQYFRGVIDEVAVYGTTLSPTRVARHHEAGTTG